MDFIYVGVVVALAVAVFVAGKVYGAQTEVKALADLNILRANLKAELVKASAYVSTEAKALVADIKKHL